MLHTNDTSIKVQEIKINSNDCYLFYTNGNSTKPREQSESSIANRALKTSGKSTRKSMIPLIRGELSKLCFITNG